MTTQTFEQVYPKAPFAELIRLGIVLGKMWAEFRDRDARQDKGKLAASA